MQIFIDVCKDENFKLKERRFTKSDNLNLKWKIFLINKIYFDLVGKKESARGRYWKMRNPSCNVYEKFKKALNSNFFQTFVLLLFQVAFFLEIIIKMNESHEKSELNDQKFEGFKTFQLNLILNWRKSAQFQVSESATSLKLQESIQ